MKRYFLCHLRQKYEFVVCLTTDEVTPNITDRVAIPDEVGRAEFGDEWGMMEMEEIEEVTEKVAIGYTGTGRLHDVPSGAVLTDE